MIGQEESEKEESDVLGTNYQPPPRKSKNKSDNSESEKRSENQGVIHFESVELGSGSSFRTAGRTSRVINSLQGVAMEI